MKYKYFEKYNSFVINIKPYTDISDFDFLYNFSIKFSHNKDKEFFNSIYENESEKDCYIIFSKSSTTKNTDFEVGWGEINDLNYISDVLGYTYSKVLSIEECKNGTLMYILNMGSNTPQYKSKILIYD
jgi:hypothetical protein